MTKQSFQDIKPPNPRKSIRDIPLSTNRQQVSRPPVQAPAPKQEYSSEHAQEEGFSTPKPPRYVPPPSTFGKEEPENTSHAGRYVILAIVLVLLVGLFIFGSNVFASATIKVTLKKQSAPVNLTVNASSDATVPGVHFDVISLSKTDSQTLTSTSTTQISQKASGTIVIYNNYSAAPQTLITNTRFQTTGGLIYRINTPVTVPGETTASSGSTVPGSVQVTVYADQPGANYNIGPSDFTIPGFQNDAGRYAGFYARGKGSIIGGYVGTGAYISDATRQATFASIDAQLKGDLAQEAEDQTPNTYVLYSDGNFITTSVLADQAATSSATESSVVLSESGTSYAIVFNKQELATYIASQTLDPSTFNPSSDLISISNIGDLSVSIQNKAQFNAASSTSISFTVNGNAQFVWNVDETKLKGDVAGIAKSTVPTVVQNDYPSVQDITVINRPFWKSSLPKNPQAITVDSN